MDRILAVFVWKIRSTALRHRVVGGPVFSGSSYKDLAPTEPFFS
jgi:hypothetical protein